MAKQICVNSGAVLWEPWRAVIGVTDRSQGCDLWGMVGAPLLAAATVPPAVEGPAGARCAASAYARCRLVSTRAANSNGSNKSRWRIARRQVDPGSSCEELTDHPHHELRRIVARAVEVLEGDVHAGHVRPKMLQPVNELPLREAVVVDLLVEDGVGVDEGADAVLLAVLPVVAGEA